MADDGTTIFYSSVKGKVSSLNSYLTSTQQIITTNSPCDSNTPCYNQNVIEALDLDGTYGENPTGIFWFDTSNVYHEWNGRYFVSDQQVRFNHEPHMVVQLNGLGNPIAIQPSLPVANH